MSKIDISSYKTQLSIRLDWSEMDLFGHINNVMFMKYIQASRVNYWQQIGLYQSFEKGETCPMLASTSCQFKQPLYFPGNIIIKAKVDFIKTTSFGLEHIILNEEEEIIAIANDVIVTYDFKKKNKVEIPEWLKDKIDKTETK